MSRDPITIVTDSGYAFVLVEFETDRESQRWRVFTYDLERRLVELPGSSGLMGEFLRIHALDTVLNNTARWLFGAHSAITDDELQSVCLALRQLVDS